MRFAVALTRWLALCGLGVGALDLTARAPWYSATFGFLAAAVFGALSTWIRCSPAVEKEGTDV